MDTYIISNIYETRAGISAVIKREDGEGEETTLLFKASFWKDEGQKKGDIIDNTRFEELTATAELCRAIARCEGMLASSDYSRARLINRLAHYGFERTVCEKAADYMISEGYIKEGEQTRRITRFYCKSKHWGKKRIAAELMGRGYDRKVIMESLSSVTDEEYYNSLLELISNKFPVPAENREEREKRIAALARMGFTAGDIIRALGEAERAFEEENEF